MSWSLLFLAAGNNCLWVLLHVYCMWSPGHWMCCCCSSRVAVTVTPRRPTRIGDVETAIVKRCLHTSVPLLVIILTLLVISINWECFPWSVSKFKGKDEVWFSPPGGVVGWHPKHFHHSILKRCGQKVPSFLVLIEYWKSKAQCDFGNTCLLSHIICG